MNNENDLQKSFFEWLNSFGTCWDLMLNVMKQNQLRNTIEHRPVRNLLESAIDLHSTIDTSDRKMNELQTKQIHVWNRHKQPPLPDMPHLLLIIC